ncbi:MAG: carboxypeptidase-like regulatory domain-containing protein, partial [Marinoscillum sp.]
MAQTGTVKGRILSDGNNGSVPFGNALIVGTSIGASADADGIFTINNVPVGRQIIQVSSIGYTTYLEEIDVVSGQILRLGIILEEENLNLNEVVVTGTRTNKRITDSPVIVNLMNKKELDQVVAINLSEGLRFQPGLRIETDCQTCNYTQLRMNGLQGGYSQILI